MAEPPLFSVNQFMVPAMPLDELAQWCRETAVAGIGLLLDAVRELGTDRTHAILRRHGRRATSVCVALGLVHPDPDRQDALYASAVQALELAARLEVPLVVVVGGPGPGLSLATARVRARDQVLRLAERASRIGARILLEPLHPGAVRWSAHTTLGESLQVASMAGGVGVVLDSWHVWTDPALAALIRAHAPDLEIVHLSDYPVDPADPQERDIPGDGLIDLAGMVRHLVEAGFTGWWETEVLSRRLAAQTPPSSLLALAHRGSRAVVSAGTAGCRNEPGSESQCA